MEDDNIEDVSEKTMQIDFIDALNLILDKKGRVFRVMIIFMILGIVIAFITPKQYTSSAIILPQISSNKGLSKKYSNIAALVGINLGQPEGNNIVPILYPIILESAPFQKAILQKKINIKELEEPITVFEYLKNYKKYGILHTIKEYTVGLPDKIINVFKSDDNEAGSKFVDNTMYQYSKEEKSFIGYLETHLLISFNDDDGYIKITATLDEPVAAAQLVSNAQDLLQDFIIAYNIKKSEDELKFIEERLEVVKENYGEKRAALGDYRDRNKNAILSTTRNREEQLKAEYDLAYTMYSELSSQRESAKLQVKRDTPIFTELQPATVSLEPSEPNKKGIIIGSTIIGILMGIVLILLPVFLDYFKKYLKKKVVLFHV